MSKREEKKRKRTIINNYVFFFQFLIKIIVKLIVDEISFYRGAHRSNCAITCTEWNRVSVRPTKRFENSDSLSLSIYMYVGIYVYIRATSGNDASEKSYFTRVAGLIVGFSTRFLAGE